MTPLRSHADLNETSNSIFATALGVTAILVGLLLLGEDHGPTKYVMEKFAPLQVWAILFVLAGTLGLAGQYVRQRPLIIAGHGLGCVLTATVGAFFYMASKLPEPASIYPAGLCLGVSVMHLIAAMVSRPHR